jgi:hypothetical protein
MPGTDIAYNSLQKNPTTSFHLLRGRAEHPAPLFLTYAIKAMDLQRAGLYNASGIEAVRFATPAGSFRSDGGKR